jgi:hypothetical protein
MDVPIYCTYNGLPIKAVATPDGGRGVYALNLDTGEFEIRTELSQIVMGYDEDGHPGADVDYLTEEKFERYVAELKRERSLP